MHKCCFSFEKVNKVCKKIFYKRNSNTKYAKTPATCEKKELRNITAKLAMLYFVHTTIHRGKMIITIQ